MTNLNDFIKEKQELMGAEIRDAYKNILSEGQINLSVNWWNKKWVEPLVREAVELAQQETEVERLVRLATEDSDSDFFYGLGANDALSEVSKKWSSFLGEDKNTE